MRKIAVYVSIAGVLVSLCLTAWFNDFVTLHGGKTVYTVDCANGSWQGSQCNGALVAGKRYRFKARKAPGEVLFWVAGSSEPSGKMIQCKIENAKEWTCPLNAGSQGAIIRAMKFGQPVWDHPASAPTQHVVSKWKWLLLQAGYPYFHNAYET